MLTLMDTAIKVASNVLAALGRAQLPKTRAAEAMGMSYGAFSKRIKGQQPFDVAELQRLAEITGVPYSELVDVESSGSR